MRIENPHDYLFIRYEITSTKNKKYDAVLRNKKTNKEKKISFGDLRYQQFKDRTGLNLYSHLDHNDPQRRRSYSMRHAKDREYNGLSQNYF
jgi:hypothetical protein